MNNGATGTIEGIGERDHGETSEYRIFGPPGTGKTTNLTRQIRRAVERYGPQAVMVTSFSRAAAAELAGRDLPVDPDRVGTLHAHCYHTLGGPEIAEANVDEWNRANPHLTITAMKKHTKLDGEESAEETGDETEKNGDEILGRLSRYRGLMLRRDLWPATLRDFETRWTTYKRENGLLDFTDLIETCLRDVPYAPKSPSVIFADEAQDLNLMQLTLVRKWGQRTNYFIVAGDDDQTIFWFTGAVPENLLDPDIPEDHKIILKQSYRVPHEVHRLANGLIHQVTRRQEKVYLARDAEGGVERLMRGSYNSPDYFVLESARQHLAARPNGDVPGLVLVHAALARRRSPEKRHTVSQPVPPVERLLEPDPDWTARIDRRPHCGAADRASRLGRGNRAPGRTATSRSGPTACTRRASFASARRKSSPAMPAKSR